MCLLMVLSFSINVYFVTTLEPIITKQMWFYIKLDVRHAKQAGWNCEHNLTCCKHYTVLAERIKLVINENTQLLYNHLQCTDDTINDCDCPIPE